MQPSGSSWLPRPEPIDLDYLSLLARIDELYEGVVMEPGQWDDASLSDWLDGAALGGDEPASKDLARELRRCVRSAQRMRDFWSQGDQSRPVDAGDWRTRVDVAMGARAWRPTLAIAQLGLQETPSEELFEEVRDRFRVVNSEYWMEGVEYSDWVGSV